METNDELNKQVAEKIMGIDLSKICEGDLGEYYDGWMCFACGKSGSWGEIDEYWNHTIHPRGYSDNIADAWKVINKLQEFGFLVDIFDDGCAWSVTFVHMDDLDTKYTADWRQSIPAQICEAALKAFEGGKEHYAEAQPQSV